jgi:hypothetical protein
MNARLSSDKTIIDTKMVVDISGIKEEDEPEESERMQ